MRTLVNKTKLSISDDQLNTLQSESSDHMLKVSDDESSQARMMMKYCQGYNQIIFKMDVSKIICV